MSSDAFPIDTAEIVGLYMQSILYGMGVITVSYGLRVLLWTRDGNLKSKQDINWVMVSVTLAMFLIATLEMAFGLRGNLYAFIYYRGPGGAKGEFSDISYWINVMRTADYVAQTFIGDGIMLYRCYVVYNRNWKVALLPGLLWLAETACGWIVVYIEATLHTETFLNNSRLVPFITSVLSLTLAMTTITTGLIAYHIMKINGRVASRNAAHNDGSIRLTRIVRILIESGLIYTVSVVVFFCTFLTGNNAQYPVSDCVVQLIPISFTLIIIRVDQGIATQQTSTFHGGISSTHAPVALKPLPPSVYPGSRGGNMFSDHVGSRSGGDSAEDMEYRWKGARTIV